jgi:hypothetical protein
MRKFAFQFVFNNTSGKKQLLSNIPVNWKVKYEGDSNENRKNFFKFNLLNESGTQLYHFST